MSDAATIQRQFQVFHAENPHVLIELEKLVRAWLEQGHGRVSIGMMWEVLRWREGIETTTADEFRLNNNYRSRYVRLLIERNPEWASAFAVRELRAA